MLYSIGYGGRLPPTRLAHIARALGAQVFDVRGIPRTRVAGYGQRQLESLLGSAYAWRGNVLGNRGENRVQPAALLGIGKAHGMLGSNALLLCACEAPGDCHRHSQIARPLLSCGIDVHHIYRDEIVRASALERALHGGAEATYAWQPLASVIGE